ncbi:hypothetical protein QL285_089484 [Trifolium repens]|nr:hypothetical protein QL285_089484 [Trifolium repens]
MPSCRPPHRSSLLAVASPTASPLPRPPVRRCAAHNCTFGRFEKEASKKDLQINPSDQIATKVLALNFLEIVVLLFSPEINNPDKSVTKDIAPHDFLRRYLVEASKDFSLNKDIFWNDLLDRCKGDHFLVDIVNYGSKLLLDEKSPQLPSLIKAGKNDFLLIGSFGDLLSHTLKLAYLPIHQLDAKNLTLECVMKFEKHLLKNGSIVFQIFFTNSKFKQSSFLQCGEQTNPDLKMDDEGKKNISVGDEKGGNSTEEQPAGTDYDHSKPSDTKQDELSKSFRAILTMYNECLKPVKVAGVKYREGMKKIHAEYSVEESSCELEKMISKWHVNAQEDVYHQFREQEEKINDADYIAEQERRKFVSRPIAGEKKRKKIPRES